METEIFMRKALLSAVAATALLSNFVVGAQALTAPRVGNLADASIVTQVRDGCGWNRHFSPRVRHCVWNWRRY